jgi:transcriptional regulator with XRE-family HTH domain
MAAMNKSLHTSQNQVFLAMLKSARKSASLPQADLATRLGRGQGTVSKVELGARRLDVIELRAWLGALGVDFLTFMGELDARLQSCPMAEVSLRPRARHRNPIHSRDLGDPSK